MQEACKGPRLTCAQCGFPSGDSSSEDDADGLMRRECRSKFPRVCLVERLDPASGIWYTVGSPEKKSELLLKRILSFFAVRYS